MQNGRINNLNHFWCRSTLSEVCLFFSRKLWSHPQTKTRQVHFQSALMTLAPTPDLVLVLGLPAAFAVHLS